MRYEDAGSAKWPGAHKENQGQFADLEIALLSTFPPGSWLVERGKIASFFLRVAHIQINQQNGSLLSEDQ